MRASAAPMARRRACRCRTWSASTTRTRGREMHAPRVTLAAALLCISAAAEVRGQGVTQQSRRVDDKIAEIQHRPEFVHAAFGAAAYDLDTHQMIYGLNAEQLFTPGSTTKLLTTGTALALLGADYRFHTPVYRTGPISNGVVRGD